MEDERIKELFGEDNDLIKCFSKINAIKYKYNDLAKQIDPKGEHNVDDETHIGIKAQELARNPITHSAVSKDESGFLQVDTRELCLNLSAVVSELCKRVENLENKLINRG